MVLDKLKTKANLLKHQKYEYHNKILHKFPYKKNYQRRSGFRLHRNLKEIAKK
jgi:hypothetical protein